MALNAPWVARVAARAGALALGAALAFDAGAAVAHKVPRPTLILSCPYTVIAPGTYVLARDLVCPREAAITVEADGVTLVLLGRTLTAAEGAFEGVFTIGTDANPTIDRLRVVGGTFRGFGEGLSIDNSPGAVITGVSATGRFEGIDIEDSPRARIIGNTFTGNETGIQVLTCDECVIAGNRADGNSDEGIELRLSTAVHIVGNRATGNGERGIELLRGTTGNRVEGNLATGNGTVDLDDGNLDLDPGPPVCVNTWRGNRFATDTEGDGPRAGCIR
jgi:parallel beta-helix repeat protein